MNSLQIEIHSRSVEAQSHTINTIYFGGGTPSLLSKTELHELLKTIRSNYHVASDAEITLEANPDDIDESMLQMLVDEGINRLSLGVQSFFDNDLRWMNRIHNSLQSHKAIELILDSGISNFSIDLMYGLPDGDLKQWENNLNFAARYGTPHLSCYALTVEERTALRYKMNTGKIQIPDDGLPVEQMNLLLDFCDQHNYEAYEISNFALPGYRSQHNSSYWEGKPYFGFGPSAHSFYDNIRRWNISNNNLYISAISNQLVYYEEEFLSRSNQCNEYLMLQLRRMEGVDTKELETKYSEFYPSILHQIHLELTKGNLYMLENRCRLTRQGKIFADQVASNLFVV